MTARLIDLFSYLSFTSKADAYLLNYWKWKTEFSITVSFSGKTKNYRVHIDFPLDLPKTPHLMRKAKQLFREDKKEQLLALSACWTLAYHLKQIACEFLEWNPDSTTLILLSNNRTFTAEVTQS